MSAGQPSAMAAPSISDFSILDLASSNRLADSRADVAAARSLSLTGSHLDASASAALYGSSSSPSGSPVLGHARRNSASLHHHHHHRRRSSSSSEAHVSQLKEQIKLLESDHGSMMDKLQKEIIDKANELDHVKRRLSRQTLALEDQQQQAVSSRHAPHPNDVLLLDQATAKCKQLHERVEGLSAERATLWQTNQKQAALLAKYQDQNKRIRAAYEAQKIENQKSHATLRAEADSLALQVKELAATLQKRSHAQKLESAKNASLMAELDRVPQLEKALAERTHALDAAQAQMAERAQQATTAAEASAAAHASALAALQTERATLQAELAAAKVQLASDQRIAETTAALAKEAHATEVMALQVQLDKAHADIVLLERRCADLAGVDERFASQESLAGRSVKALHSTEQQLQGALAARERERTKWEADRAALRQKLAAAQQALASAQAEHAAAIATVQAERDHAKAEQPQYASEIAVLESQLTSLVEERNMLRTQSQVHAERIVVLEAELDVQSVAAHRALLDEQHGPARVTELEHQIKLVRDQLAAATQQRDTLASQCQQLESQAQDVKHQITSITADRAMLADRVDEAHVQLLSAQTQLAETNAVMAPIHRALTALSGDATAYLRVDPCVNPTPQDDEALIALIRQALADAVEEARVLRATNAAHTQHDAAAAARADALQTALQQIDALIVHAQFDATEIETVPRTTATHEASSHAAVEPVAVIDRVKALLALVQNHVAKTQQLEAAQRSLTAALQEQTQRHQQADARELLIQQDAERRINALRSEVDSQVYRGHAQQGIISELQQRLSSAAPSPTAAMAPGVPILGPPPRSFREGFHLASQPGLRNVLEAPLSARLAPALLSPVAPYAGPASASAVDPRGAMGDALRMSPLHLPLPAGAYPSNPAPARRNSGHFVATWDQVNPVHVKTALQAAGPYSAARSVGPLSGHSVYSDVEGPRTLMAAESPSHHAFVWPSVGAAAGPALYPASKPSLSAAASSASSAPSYLTPSPYAATAAPAGGEMSYLATSSGRSATQSPRLAAAAVGEVDDVDQHARAFLAIDEKAHWLMQDSALLTSATIS
ncbi:hypothetical protein CXG81DRAFT_23452 [Caulochytrium protostelioides]|uniref:Uncharacterized protein n=1 Tax=Caulochytrium protostelioides TaxID=1555241 RepID=A0A4P9XEC5_9FUNG|nr:hypothetical protein CXG81DRAFT_23452 [Caulochytrium protostelioides]|eukprot:RKP03896.1 hypothetical protein CXG81DRAFT_23452 [Caulochytrium protostelioides]